MTILSITLSALLVIALILLLLPLSKKFEANKKAIIGIGVFIPLFSLSAYFVLGTPEFAEMTSNKEMPKQVTLVEKLEQKLQKNPKDLNGWLLLGRSYMVTKEYPKAIRAFEKAYVLDSHNLSAILQLADAVAISQDGNLIGRPYQLLLHAYELDDENQMALWLLGMAEKQLDNPESAALYWQQLYQLIPNDSKDKKTVQKLLSSVGKDVALPKDEQASNSSNTPKDMSETESISFKVDKNLVAKHPEAQVFIYAKATSGMPMPIAAEKYQLQKLPNEIILDQSNTLMPSRSLEQNKKLLVGIKISLGSATDKVLYKAEKPYNNKGYKQITIKLKQGT